MFRNFFIGTSQSDNPFEGLNPLLWCDRSIVHNGGLVSQWTDKSGNGHHLTQSIEGNKPDYTTDNGGGVSFSGNGETLIAVNSALSGVFNCLHDGLGGTVFIKLKCDDITTVSSTMCLLDSGGLSTGRTGHYIYINTAEDIGFSPTLSSGGNRVYNNTSGIDFFLDGQVWKLKNEYENARAGNDNINLLNDFEFGGETDNAPNIGNHTNDLTIGDREAGTGGQPFRGDIYHISIFDRILSADELIIANAYIDSL